MKNLLSILFIGLAAVTLAAEPEVDIDSTYFHPAASMYIQGNSTGASNLVSTGLLTFPDNGKLMRLKELLDQQQEDNKDQDQNEDQDQEDQDQQDEEKQDQQNQDQNKDQQNQDDQQQDQQDPQEPEQQNDQQQEPEQQPPSAEQMSKDEAQRLLDAMKQEEENKRLQLHPVMGAPVHVDKDW